MTALNKQSFKPCKIICSASPNAQRIHKGLHDINLYELPWTECSLHMYKLHRVQRDSKRSLKMYLHKSHCNRKKRSDWSVYQFNFTLISAWCFSGSIVLRLKYSFHLTELEQTFGGESIPTRATYGNHCIGLQLSSHNASVFPMAAVTSEWPCPYKACVVAQWFW